MLSSRQFNTSTSDTLDQPLFAIAKQIHWNWPASHEENQFVIMLGGLHIGMATFKGLGNWLDGSGWTSVIAIGGSGWQSCAGYSLCVCWEWRYYLYVLWMRVWLLDNVCISCMGL